MATMPNNTTVDTVNAAATAIVTAETRLQPSSLQKSRWASCLSVYWCFGSCKHSKRIGHGVLVPEPTLSSTIASSSETSNNGSATTTTTTTILPFIAPPSSPAAFPQSDPPSGIQTPAGLLSLTSLSVNAYCTNGRASVFTVGPYAYETQLVTPPVFSAGTTEPSTAAYTPPPESVQPTAPSSPDVPFAQLLASSLARNRRNSKSNHKLSLSQYEFQPYQYTGSPGGNLKSPPSVVSNSGTSSPYPGKQLACEFPMSEGSKFLGYDHFTTHKWGSRLGSGSLTPNGWGSRLGSGSVTPSGGVSRLGSGTLTPNGGGAPVSRDIYLLDSQIYEEASLADSDNLSPNHEAVVDHRVSFELLHEESPNILTEQLDTSYRTTSEVPADRATEATTNGDRMTPTVSEVSCEYCMDKSIDGTPSEINEKEPANCHHKRRTITLGSTKDFNFDSTNEEDLDKSTIECQWWKNEKIVGDSIDTDNDWTFFPMLQPGVS